MNKRLSLLRSQIIKEFRNSYLTALEKILTMHRRHNAQEQLQIYIIICNVNHPAARKQTRLGSLFFEVHVPITKDPYLYFFFTSLLYLLTTIGQNLLDAKLMIRWKVRNLGRAPKHQKQKTGSEDDICLHIKLK